MWREKNLCRLSSTCRLQGIDTRTKTRTGAGRNKMKSKKKKKLTEANLIRCQQTPFSVNFYSNKLTVIALRIEGDDGTNSLGKPMLRGLSLTLRRPVRPIDVELTNWTTPSIAK